MLIGEVTSEDFIEILYIDLHREYQCYSVIGVSSAPKLIVLRAQKELDAQLIHRYVSVSSAFRQDNTGAVYASLFASYMDLYGTTTKFQ